MTIRFLPGEGNVGRIFTINGEEWRAKRLLSLDDVLGDTWECERVSEWQETVPAVPPCFPPEVARAHAAELRQAVADLLEWSANSGRWQAETWKRAQTLMNQIRDEEDAAREAQL